MDTGREKILEIRRLSRKLTGNHLDAIAVFLNYHDWKVRLEVTKALKKFVDGEPMLQARAMDYLMSLNEDIHPVVRLCVFEIRRLKYAFDEKNGR